MHSRTATVLGSQPTHPRSFQPLFHFSAKYSWHTLLLDQSRMGNTKTKHQALTPEEELKQLVATANITGQTWKDLEKNLRAHIDKDIKREWAVSNVTRTP